MHFKLYYWPILSSCWTSLTIILAYLISVLGGNVYPLFPYISDIGIKPPGSCVFGQMMNIAAVLIAVTLYVRYRQVDFVIKSGSTDLPRKWNNVDFWLGNFLALGVSVVGNFQGDIKGSIFVIATHFVGAAMAFGVGAIYITIQTKLTFGLRPVYVKYPECRVGSYVSYFRLFLTIWSYILLLVAIVCGVISFSRFTGDDTTWWTSEHDGYTAHLVSAVAEWLLAFALLGYCLTFTSELKFLEYKEICFESKHVRGTNGMHESL